MQTSIILLAFYNYTFHRSITYYKESAATLSFTESLCLELKNLKNNPEMRSFSSFPSHYLHRESSTAKNNQTKTENKPQPNKQNTNPKNQPTHMIHPFRKTIWDFISRQKQDNIPMTITLSTHISQCISEGSPVNRHLYRERVQLRSSIDSLTSKALPLSSI